MCSEAEAKDREACLELSALEIVDGTQQQRRPSADVSKTVKKYQRPAAGAPPPPLSSLRPLPVLERTVDYLLRVWAARLDVPPLARFLFLSDRLRAVQQDLSVQRLHSIPLLARIVRFHLLAEAQVQAKAQAEAQAQGLPVSVFTLWKPVTPPDANSICTQDAMFFGSIINPQKKNIRVFF